MSGSNPKVIVDADALIGLINQDDDLHGQCLAIAKALSQHHISTLIPYTAVLEAATALAKGKAINRPDLAAKLFSTHANTHQDPIDETGISSQVAKLYTPKTSKKNTPFDFYILAVAQVNKAEAIFSFDQFYPRQGMALARDWIKAL